MAVNDDGGQHRVEIRDALGDLGRPINSSASASMISTDKPRLPAEGRHQPGPDGILDGRESLPSDW